MVGTDGLKPEYAVNLDGLSRVGLAEMLHTYQTLAEYATKKLAALEARFAGNIQTASALESECDRIYERLPPEFKW